VTEARLFGLPLPEAGTIGVVAPASGFENRSEVLRGVEWWEERGFRVKLGEHVFDRDDYVAGDERSRAADLMAMFTDPGVDVVQALQGGYGSAQTIPHLDFEVIAQNPKPFVGYSDITALHVAMRQRTGLATFYGEGAGKVPRDPDDPYVRAIASGKITAPLVGGCLWLLLQTMGTPWEVELEGCIFFFEDYDAPPWYVDGMLTQLGHAGKLAGVRGVVVGDMEKCDWRESRPEWPRTRSIEDVLEKHLEPLGVPVLYKLPLGHGKHLAALPLGVTATLDADARTLTIEHPGLTTEGERP
jgi:muramoyltetrapeptide carboxypeptidase